MIRFNEEDICYVAVELPDEIKFFKYNGDFAGELEAIKKYRQKAIPQCLDKRLEIEEVIARNMQHDYKMTFEELLAKIQEHYPLCKAENLEYIIDLGNADYIRKNGVRYFQRSVVSNILGCNQTYLRTLPNPEKSDWRNPRRHENLEIMQKKGYRSVRYRVIEHCMVKRPPKTPGDLVRVHLPFPNETDVQKDIVINAQSHNFYISNAPQRTAFAEVPYEDGLEFTLDFSYTLKVPYVKVDPTEVSKEQPTFFTGEELPQIRLTPLIRETAKELKGDETNPLILARRAYDFVTTHMVYSYMRDYFCIENIPEFALMNGRGDCGVQALLFINLCRAMGVPAKWESGSHVEKDSIGSHDWARFYVAPYGWLWCDPSFGGGALRNGDLELWNHYATNFDIFREINATEFASPFDPPRHYLRTDPYDNQSGECEFANEPMWYGDFEMNREVVEFTELD